MKDKEVVHIYGLPRDILKYDDKIPRVKDSGRYISDYGITSWLRINRSADISVVVHNERRIPDWPATIDLEVRTSDDKSNLEVVVRVSDALRPNGAASVT